MLSPRFMSHTVLYTQSVVRIPVFRHPQSAVHRSPSAVRRWPSAVGRLQSAVRCPQSMFYTDRNPTILDRLIGDKRFLFRRYAGRRAFITKTRTIILFTNTTLSRLGFGGIAIEHFHFQNNETEDMLV